MPLRGSDKLQKRLGEIAGRLGDSPKVRVGFLENATYPDGKPVAMIAAIHNFGKWPFFTNMIEDKKGEWPAAIGDLLVANNYDAGVTLDKTGHAIAGQLRQSIVDISAPPLADSTIIRKGGHAGMVYNAQDPSTFPAKPMIHTGHMLNSVDHEVKI